MKWNAENLIGPPRSPLPHPIIPIHFLEKSLENPSLFFAQNYNKMGRYMLWTVEFGGLPEDQEFCPLEDQRLCLRTFWGLWTDPKTLENTGFLSLISAKTARKMVKQYHFDTT